MRETIAFALSIVQFIVCLVLIASVLFQSSKSDGLGGALSGSAETFFGKDGARSLDAKLGKITKAVAVLFILLTFALIVI